MQINFKKRNFYFLFFFIIQSAQAFDKISLTDPSVLFSVEDQTVPVVSVNYVGWDAGWKWADSTVSPKFFIGNTNVSGFAGQANNLGIFFNGTVTPALLPSSSQIDWNYNWTFAQDHPNAIGFGLEFNLNLNSPSFSTTTVPQLLGKDGWRWDTTEGSIEVKFTPALANLYFELNQKNKIRAMFFGAIITGIKPPTTMTVTVNRKIALSAPVKFNYDSIDPAKWHQAVLPDTVSPVDLSILNKDARGKVLPAGNRGFITANGDQLGFVYGKPSKFNPVKFWGANIQASALFNTDDGNIALHAKRIAQLGFNLVRIHHHDSEWVNPNIFRTVDNTLELSPKALNKLDRWIYSLKREGVYVWLDLHVGRAFTINDGIDNFNDFAKGKSRAEAKGFNYYNDSIQRRMQQFNEAYLNHVNSYTKLAYKNDPAIVGALLTNENDLSFHFGNALLGDKGVPIHNAIFTQDAKQFAGLYGLPLNKTLMTWVMGESKLYLNDVEHRFNQKMLDHLDLLGVKALVATTNSWGAMGLYGLASLTDGDIIDVHSYGSAEEFNYNPRYNPGFLSRVAAAQVTGKPLSVTEWNIDPFPADDRFTAPIFTASLASLQGWDAMMLYGYSQTELNGNTKTGSNWSAFNDPAMMGMMPAAALLYRQNHVSVAKQSYELKLGRNDFFFKNNDATTSKTIRTLLETSRLTIGMPDAPELPWLKNNVVASSSAIPVADPDKDFIPAGQNYVESDTNELKRDWELGIHTINTEKSQISSGWIGGKAITLDDVAFNITTKKAVVAVQSLEDRPIFKSTKIFITAMARSQLSNGANLPFLSEPVLGTIAVHAPAGLSLYTVTKTGTESKPQAISYDSLKGAYTIDLKSADGHWLILK
jgi:Cellulase (glycosyl hydrolase family 5)